MPVKSSIPKTFENKIVKLDKDVALIKQEIRVLKTNHLHHLDMKINWTLKILAFVGATLFAEFFLLIKYILTNT